MIVKTTKATYRNVKRVDILSCDTRVDISFNNGRNPIEGIKIEDIIYIEEE